MRARNKTNVNCGNNNGSNKNKSSNFGKLSSRTLIVGIDCKIKK
jgi:hypothetical protein